jgi:hypothetical protein
VRQDWGVAKAEESDRLYALPPRRFVAERDAAAAQAKAAGDTTSAAALKKLRRPTVSAWLVNLLALRRPQLMSDLAELATALREAQRELRGDQLRELAGQRRGMVSALVAEAKALAIEVDPALAGGSLPLAEVESTLHAALVDGEVAAQVRAGRLTRAVTPTGFGEPPRPRLRLVEGGGGADLAEARRLTRQAAEAELADARAAAEAARADLDRATAAQREAAAAVEKLDQALAELADRRRSAAAELADAEVAALGARRAVVAARRRVGDAEAAVEASG